MAHSRRPLWLTGALLVLVASALVASPAGATTLTFAPVADAYVAKPTPGTNFGTAPTLRVRDGRIQSYLRFDVAGIPSGESVSSAKLRLFSSTGDACGTAGAGVDAYRAASDSWTESGITFNNAPGKSGALLGSADGFAANSYLELDVTGALAANGTVGLYLEMPACTTDSVPTRFNSDEASSNRPQLVVTTAGTTPPQCSDGLDNDGDGITDFPGDPGCTDAQDDDETDPAAGGVSVAAAGDIACDPNSTYFDGSNPAQCQHRLTDDLLAGSDAVLALGDLQYSNGSLAKFNASYDPSWGQAAASRTYPAPGNHEYQDGAGGAQGYFDYWASKGRPTGGAGAGYYSFDLGAWHLISLNTSDGANEVPCELGPSCAEGSPQNDWLEQDLAAVPQSSCVLAYWHHPLFNSGGSNGNNDTTPVRAFWEDLYAAGADLIVNGHEHNYQRYAPLTPDGVQSPSGIRELISGGGGKNLTGLLSAKDPGYEFGVRSFGMLKLELSADSYSWEFVNLSGTVLDSGGPVTCHGAPAASQTFAGDAVSDGKRTPSVAQAAAVSCGGRKATIIGTDGDDYLEGTSGTDVIHGLSGDDVIESYEGDDVICGGRGDDSPTLGDDLRGLFGGPGHDRIHGGKGSDLIGGGNSPSAQFEDGTGSDVMMGGMGHDTICDEGCIRQAVARDQGDDRLIGGPGVDEMVATDGRDTCQQDGDQAETPCGDD